MNKIIVFQTDFGLDDAAISAMEGVSYSVSQDLNIRHLTHNIPQYNIFDASYRLHQAITYWPEGTVFVSVVDPGVGSNRKSVVAKTVTNQYVVTPDNGTLTHIDRFIGIEEIREIEERTNRLKNSELSYTFHGRDVYAYTAARLASETISFEQVGPLGRSLPRNDSQTTTQPGDIVLYSGNQIVVFYGSNSWAYTRLGHVELSQQEMTELLGGGDVVIRISQE